MRHLLGSLLIGGVVLCAGMPAAADGEHAHGASGAQTLTGEVVDVTCYLTHPESGIGPKHADCARKCIEGGLPVAIRAGNQLYLAVGSQHASANKTLAQYAGRRVTVTGIVAERDGQHLIAISNVTPAD